MVCSVTGIRDVCSVGSGATKTAQKETEKAARRRMGGRCTRKLKNVEKKRPQGEQRRSIAGRSAGGGGKKGKGKNKNAREERRENNPPVGPSHLRWRSRGRDRTNASGCEWESARER